MNIHVYSYIYILLFLYVKKEVYSLSLPFCHEQVIGLCVLIWSFFSTCLFVGQQKHTTACVLHSPCCATV